MVAQRANHNEFLAIFSKNGSRIWKNWLVFFQISIHFHPYHAKWKMAINGFSVLIKSKVTKLHHYFWVSIDAGTCFGTVKWRWQCPFKTCISCKSQLAHMGIRYHFILYNGDAINRNRLLFSSKTKNNFNGTAISQRRQCSSLSPQFLLTSVASKLAVCHEKSFHNPS